jgi:hypothetical protein
LPVQPRKHVQNAAQLPSLAHASSVAQQLVAAQAAQRGEGVVRPHASLAMQSSEGEQMVSAVSVLAGRQQPVEQSLAVAHRTVQPATAWAEYVTRHAAPRDALIPGPD